MKYLSTIVIIMFSFIAFSTQISLAQLQEFFESDNKLFDGWLDLATVPDPLVEYGAYAIVWTGGTNLPIIYTIYSNYKGKIATLGAFRCDKEFTVLKTATYEMRDIRCVRQNVFGQKTTTILSFSKGSGYEEWYK